MKLFLTFLIFLLFIMSCSTNSNSLNSSENVEKVGVTDSTKVPECEIIAPNVFNCPDPSPPSQPGK